MVAENMYVYKKKQRSNRAESKTNHNNKIYLT